MTLAAFTGTPVLDDGKVAIRSLAAGRTFMGAQQAILQSRLNVEHKGLVNCAGGRNF
jgi:hypothetical protein